MTELTDYTAVTVDLAPASTLNNQMATGLQDTILQAAAQGDDLPANVVPGPVNMVAPMTTENSDPADPVANQVQITEAKNSFGGFLIVAGIAGLIYFSQKKTRR